MRTITKRMPCRLSDQDRLQYGEQMAETTEMLAGVQNDRKTAQSQFAAREKEYNARLARIAGALRAGTEYRDVECTVRLDDGGLTETIIRNDTGEVVEARKLPQPALLGDMDDLMAPEPDQNQTEAIPEPDPAPEATDDDWPPVESHETVDPVTAADEYVDFAAGVTDEDPIETPEEQREALERVLAIADAQEAEAEDDAEAEAAKEAEAEGDGSDGYDVRRVSVIYRNTGGHLFYAAVSERNPDLYFVARKTPRGQVTHYAGIDAGEMVRVLADLGDMAKRMHMTEVTR